ncbi:MAG TPA: Gfo/Idh/MocA family oxidoreductase [Candidatus Glassbacteria bacterium]|nr:Gfo/Idh/MocA family oxidoreductase [Candidatus Glassbacteria bacterium]
MPDNINRKEFIKYGAAAGIGLAAATGKLSAGPEPASGSVGVGLIGCGNRGRSLLATMLSLPNLRFPALCDVQPENAAQAAKLISERGHPEPTLYTKGDQDFRRLLERADLQAVIIASPWHWHTPMAVAAMQNGKYAGVEVPAAITIEECWELVETHEKSGVPCMMLENWSFRRDNLAVLNMIRAGLLGEIVHCHCAHSHDCIDHWFFDPQGNMRWGGEYLRWRNADQYPTHSQGPVLSWMDIGCGDYYDWLTSTATRSSGINAYFTRKFGPDHPNARRSYAQGDIVTTVIRTVKGSTLVINYDMQLPRPYDNRWMIQGTLGIYNEQRASIYLTGRSPQYHEWEPFEPYQVKHEHPWWKEMLDNPDQYGHGGTDYLELKNFFEAVASRSQTPIDVYDSVVMSSIVALSEESIAKGSAPVKYPDFTRGRWRTRRPSFAVTV